MMDSKLNTLLKNIRMVYQPIIDLTSGFFYAQEALDRGEEGSDYENPLCLIDYFNARNQTHVFDL